jgi:predicted nucleic acid-binding protein
MIIADTNVISEVVRGSPDSRVLAWWDEHRVRSLCTTSITAGELLYGVAKLPEGKRKTELTLAIFELLETDLGGRIEPFEAIAAPDYAKVMAGRERAGRPVGVADAQIAAICRVKGAILATRNVLDFDGTGVEIVNPWDN